jgi:predicted PurR-regulated permease PerM
MFKTSEPFKMNISNATVIEIAVHLGVIGFLAYWTFTLILPFAPVVLWSVVLTVALYPVFDWLAQKLQGRRRLAAALLTLLGLLVVIGPVTWLGIGLVEGGRELVARVNEGQLSVPPPSEGVKDWPLVGPLVYDYWARASTNLASVLSPLLPQLRPVGETLLGAAGSAGMGTLKFLASVIIAGFMFNPGPSLLAATRRFARRVDPDRGESFVTLTADTIRAVSRGVIGVSLLQAVIAAVGMSAAKVPGASLITVLILAFGIVQIGPWPICVLLIAWGWMNLPTFAAFAFTLCMLTVGLIENIAKPFALSHGLKTPMPVTFLGVIGGVMTHGIAGLFMGPVVLAVAWEVAKNWIEEEGEGIEHAAQKREAAFGKEQSSAKKNLA